MKLVLTKITTVLLMFILVVGTTACGTNSQQTAYAQVAAKGYSGTAAQFLASLAGEVAENNAWSETEKTAYEMAKEAGYTGTQAEWLTSLLGHREEQPDNRPVYEIVCANGYKGSLSEWLFSLVESGEVLSQTETGEKTAYEYALEYGFNGSFTDWLAFLVGETSASADR